MITCVCGVSLSLLGSFVEVLEVADNSMELTVCDKKSPLPVMIAWPVVFTVIVPDCGHNYNPSRGAGARKL